MTASRTTRRDSRFFRVIAAVFFLFVFLIHSISPLQAQDFDFGLGGGGGDCPGGT